MPKKFAFIGAGSFEFTNDLVRDILTFPLFGDAEFALMDIDPERLDYAKRSVEAIIVAGNYPAMVTATLDRVEALRGADGVLITILQGGVDVWRHDIEIPAKYGVDINVGDTRGPSGIFRFLRTAPVMLDIIRDVERVCPNAIVLNYTNPMALLCGYLQRQTEVSVTGLCHSVQGTAELLAGFLGADEEDITYTCAGINHQAFFIKFDWNGKDAIPLLRDLVAHDPVIYNTEPVRSEMFLNLGYYPSESSGHNSEYNPWFRKRPDLIERYCTSGTGWNPGVHRYILDEYLMREDTWKDEFERRLTQESVDLDKGTEYAADIFNAIFGDHTPFNFNCNVRNFGLIDNLPQGACVEVPAIASKDGITPIPVGSLPDNLAILINTSARCEELAIDAAIEGDAWKVFQAILFDPLTSAVLSMDETKQLVREMLEQNKDYLGFFHSLNW
ncbi:MAG: alpha-glucosidase/alpha-galactosidase [Coriobacteriia bacterium]|nr:alpha-glucosidase/alpha-galactosidase [Coriobacteriia bacterium]